MTVYLDTSSLVKLFVDERQSGDIRELVARASAVSTSEIAYPETRAALARRRSDGSLSSVQFQIAKRSFETSWLDVLTIPVTAAVCREAGDLAEAYRLRGFDSIHLASFAETLRGLQGRDDVEFSSFDDRLSAAARKLARRLR